MVFEKIQRKPNTQCIICDKLIYRRPVLLQASKGRAFCSNACYGKACRRELPCIVCGKLILAHKHTKTCSRACANKNRTGIKYERIGNNDKVKSQRALKLRLLKVKGKICERCDYAKFEILQIHHKDRNRSNNSISNLELICPNCHYEEHFLKKSWLRDIPKKERIV